MLKGPVTFDMVLGIVSTLATFVIGVAASLLAYQQFKIQKANSALNFMKRGTSFS